MRPRFAIPLLVLLAGTAHAASKPSTQEICHRAEATKLPHLDPAAPVAKDCDAEALYDGVGRPPDAKAARACALAKWDAQDGREPPRESAGVLAMIYANGMGVPRDLDIAIAYACQLDGAPAEMSGRIEHLVELKTKGPGTAPFDICDDITSGFMMGICAERSSAKSTATRDAKIAALTRPLDGAHKAAFAKLQKAKDTFITAVVDNEVDTSGTGRGAFIAEARDSHQAAFLKTLEGALGGTLPPSSQTAFETADKALNAAYAKVMGLKDASILGTVEKKGIKATQRRWIAYRDAFSAFVANTSTTPQQVALALTEQRTKDLSQLAP